MSRAIRIGAALAAVLTVLGGCSAPATAPPPPARADVLADGVESLLASSGRFDQVRAVIVDVAGDRRLVRGDPASRGDVHSITKSVVSTLVGIAIDHGLIVGVDATLAELLPTYAPTMPAPMRTATLRQVLTMTAGIPSDQALDGHPPAPTDDRVGYALTVGPQHPPGAGFVYSTTGSHLLSAVLTQATGMSTHDYARRELFGPLDIPAGAGSGPPWESDPQGRQLGGTGLSLSADEMLGLGRLFLAGGAWNGSPLVSAGWVAEATRTHVDTGGPLPGYGYQWWVTTAADHPAFAAAGYGGQLIEVVPDLDLVVVVRSDVGARPGAGPEDYAEMVDAVIAPVVGSR